MNEYTPTNSKKSQASHKTRSVIKPLAAIIVAIVLCGLSFYTGIRYQKAHDNPSRTAQNERAGQRGGNGPGGRFGRERPVEGTVTAVSSTSLTIKESGGSSKTYAIDAATVVSNNRQTAAVSDIKTGDTVAVMPNASNTSTARRIIINPSFNGPRMDNSNDTEAPGGAIND